MLLVGGGLWIWAQHSAAQEYEAMKHTRSNIPVNSKSWKDSKNEQELGGGTKGGRGEQGEGIGPLEGGSGGLRAVLDESELIIDGSTEDGQN